MISLKNRTIADNGDVYCNVEQAYELIMEGFDIGLIKIEDSDDLKNYNAAVKIYEDMFPIDSYQESNLPYADEDAVRQNMWFIPDEYKNIDVLDYLLEKVNSEKEKLRICEEYVIYEKYELIMVLRLMIYLFDLFRKQNVVYGVGRGSSVSSYILYVIGVHRVNSLKYGLDFSEFLE